MLLFLIIPLFGFSTLIVDVLRYRSLRRRTGRRHLRYALWCGVTDALPAVVLLGWLLPDNSTAYMMCVMWSVWLWLLFVPTRLLWYAFEKLHLRRTGSVVCAGIVLLMIWGLTLGRTTIRVSRVEIRSPRIPEQFDGYRIVQLSDLHLGTILRPEQELGRIADSVRGLNPDLVVFTGDLVNIRSTEIDGRMMRLLGRLPLPLASVTGNHDLGVYIRDTLSLPCQESYARTIAAQRELGWEVLMDTTVYLRRSGDSIALTGFAFDSELREQRHERDLHLTALDQAYDGVPEEIYNIVLVHAPQFWGDIAEARRGDLTLAGHVHSMQSKLRLGGWSWSPAALLYKEWSGRYDRDGRTLYINDGTGCVGFPMRLGAYPEITLFTLRSCE